jgi:hypothetical protein
MRRGFFFAGRRVSGNWLVACMGTLDSGVLENSAGWSAALPGAGKVMARLLRAGTGLELLALLLVAAELCGRTTCVTT